MFDDLMLLSEGHCVYFGPAEGVLGYFEQVCVCVCQQGLWSGAVLVWAAGFGPLGGHLGTCAGIAVCQETVTGPDGAGMHLCHTPTQCAV